MLTHEQLDLIIQKPKLDEIDIILLQDHIDYIGRLKAEYSEGLPWDVWETLQADLRLIIARLKTEYTNLSGKICPVDGE